MRCVGPVSWWSMSDDSFESFDLDGSVRTYHDSTTGFSDRSFLSVPSDFQKQTDVSHLPLAIVTHASVIHSLRR